jgi:asparagine synthase (glutamine-hydrolysing)
MLAAIAHRGPDGHGVFRRQYGPGHDVFLGHTRLAIIDPQGAAQPMCDPDAGLALTFNGEIYNFRELRAQLMRAGFRFVLDSDTEVLLRAYQYWKGDVVHRLRGMFAFAIWDAREQSLFLARDRFGEKPLFLHEQNGSLYFASEIKSLLEVPGVARTVDLESVWQYLAYRYVPGPATLFAGIRKLPPATSAVWRRGVLTETRYWAPPDRDAYSPPLSVGDAVGGFSRRLEEAVTLQMVADTPLGAFLSGGIDSSVIVALMSRRRARLKTFSVGFHEGRYSELPFAAEVAKRFGTDHHELIVSHADLVNRLEPLVAMRDGPVSEPSDIALHLLAREAARTVKTVLTGEGSDEVLGGYPKHRAERMAVGFQRLPSWLRRGLIEPLVHALPYGCRRIKTAVTSLNLPDRRERYVRWFGALSERQRERLTSFRGADDEPLDHRPPFDADPRASALRRILYFDQTSWLPDNLLERADRMTMAASLEARVPFLDHELARYVSALPDRYRVRGLTGKWILREAAKLWLPRRILTRPKVGFRLPVNEWLRGPMRDYLLDHLRSRNALTRDYYDARTLDALLDEHLAGRQNHEKLLWALLNLEVWHRCYAIPPGRATTAASLRRVA